MTALAPTLQRSAEAQAAHDRIAHVRAVRAANIKRLAEKMARWAERPNDDWCEIEATDAAYIVFECDDLHTRLGDLLHDMGLDEEGYPLADEGDRNWSADRRYVPMVSEVM